MALDQAAVNNVLKLQYTQPRVETLAIGAVLYSIFAKKTDWVGGDHPVAIRSALPGGSSTDFATALAVSTASKYKRFTAKRKHAYQVAILDGETQDTAESSAGAQLDAIKAEVDGTTQAMIERIEMDLCGNGGGALGQFTSTSNPATTVMTLRNPADALKFFEGMVLQTAATDGTSGAIKAGTVTLAKVNVDTGDLTATGNWTAGIATAAASDWAFRSGDFQSVNSHLFGINAYVPLVAPTTGDNFLGTDRSVDVQKLAGVRYTAGTGGAIDEILIRLATEVSKPANARPDLAVISPTRWGELVQQIESRSMNVRYGKVQSTNGQFGYDSIMLVGPKGPIDVISVPFYTNDTAHVLQKNTWYLKSAGGFPKILSRDGMRMQRLYNADADGVRVGYYGEAVCIAPGWNGIALL